MNRAVIVRSGRGGQSVSFFVALLAMPAFANGPRVIDEDGGSYTECLSVGFNLIGVQLFDPIVAEGTIDEESGATITDFDADFSVALSNPQATYLLEILDGPQAGAVAEILDPSITATSFAVAEPLGAGLASYQIRPAPTLSALFAGKLEGSAFVPRPTTDLVWLPDGIGGFEQFFYSSMVGEFRSVRQPFAEPAKPMHVFYPDAFFVQVRSVPKDVVISGVLKRHDTLVVAKEGFNLVAVNPPIGSTLGNCGLGEFLVYSVSPNSADVVWIPDGSGGFDRFFHVRTGVERWRSVSTPFFGDESERELPSGIMIQRREDRGEAAGLFTVPPFYTDP